MKYITSNNTVFEFVLGCLMIESPEKGINIDILLTENLCYRDVYVDDNHVVMIDTSDTTFTMILSENEIEELLNFIETGINQYYKNGKL